MTMTQRGLRTRRRPGVPLKHEQRMPPGAWKLRAWRKARGLTQAQFAELCGQSIRELERGAVRPSLRLVAAIEDITGIDVREWVDAGDE